MIAKHAGWSRKIVVAVMVAVTAYTGAAVAMPSAAVHPTSSSSTAYGMPGFSSDEVPGTNGWGGS